MTINLHLPSQNDTLRPRITVVGVGGAGGNAVNNMISSRLDGVEFVVANTDAQALENSLTDRAIQLGASVTRGLGAGADPRVGAAAAEEALDEIVGYIQGSNMVFITAGMGGGTGTGAAPVVAKAAKEQGILTVGVVTKPFQFEGGNRMRMAEEGLKELQEHVDTLIVIPNQNLFRLANEKTTFSEAFRMADEVLHSGVRGVTDLMVKPGLVNLDFADIRTVMREMGKAMMGTGEASGDKRAVEAAESAISNPLLDDVSLKGARAALINITGGSDMTLFEVDEAANRIREEIDGEANIIFGSAFNDELDGVMRVSVVATGIDAVDVARVDPMSTSEKMRSPRPFSYMPSGGKAATGGATKTVAANEPRSQAAVVVPVQRPAAKPMSAAAPAARAMKFAPVIEEPEMFEAPVQQAAPVRETMFEAAPAAPEYMEEPVSVDAGPLFGNAQEQQPVARSFESGYRPSSLKEKPTEEQSSRGGLFGRIAEVGRALSAKMDDEMYDDEGEAEYTDEAEAIEPAYQPKQRSQARPADAAPKEATAEEVEGDYYDIPAFLRRQAN